jgi:hypothetical protein
VRRDDFDDLELAGPEELLEVRRGPEVSYLPVAPGKGLVGDEADEVLEKAVLATLRRARVALDRENFFAQKRREQGLERLAGRGRSPRSAPPSPPPRGTRARAT